MSLRIPIARHIKQQPLISCRIISIGKFGSFPANLLLGRPYYLTFEILDKSENRNHSELRVVPAAELHAQILEENEATPAESRDASTPASREDGVEYVAAENGDVIMRSNRLTVDDPSRQALTMEEIERLKKAATGSGRDIIAAIMKSHSALDEKTAFSLAKYTLRKSKKYLRRFTVLPLDVSRLTEWMALERDPMKIMEMREETLSLISSWTNVFHGASNGVHPTAEGVDQVGGGRWLVMDETGGLVVAALAERMGILYPDDNEDVTQDEDDRDSIFEPQLNGLDGSNFARVSSLNLGNRSSSPGAIQPQPPSSVLREGTDLSRSPPARHGTSPKVQSPLPLTNTITLLHPAAQPNLSLLSYFSYTPPSSSLSRVTPHPLNASLKTLSLLSLLHPHLEPSYTEPPVLPAATLSALKSAKRGAYYRKRRRWEKAKEVIDETRAGGFDALVVCSFMRPESILRHTVELVRGGGQVVVYSPTVEPLTELMDHYSSARRTAFIIRQREQAPNSPSDTETLECDGKKLDCDLPNDEADDDFLLNPTLLLAPTLQTARAREWQVLPGRTHPLMTARGGAEGYLFTATRVLPAEGRVEARGKFAKKRKVEGGDASSGGGAPKALFAARDNGRKGVES